MKYGSGRALRTALEDRLRAHALDSGIPLSRLRKTVAFDRLLARLMADEGDRWLLKGGLALQVRLHKGARNTKDVDVLFRETGQDAHRRLADAARLDSGDCFEFEVGAQQVMSEEVGIRVPMHCRLDSREFESFHIDIGVGDPVVGDVEPLIVTDLLAFAEIPPTRVSCYPVSQHLAEKLHALTRPHGGRENSRAKDLVDVVIFAETSRLEAAEAIAAIAATFAARATHSLPQRLPAPPRSWDQTYRQLSSAAMVATAGFDDAVLLARTFVDPLLAGAVVGRWDPEGRSWRA